MLISEERRLAVGLLAHFILIESLPLSILKLRRSSIMASFTPFKSRLNPLKNCTSQLNSNIYSSCFQNFNAWIHQSSNESKIYLYGALISGFSSDDCAHAIDVLFSLFLFRHNIQFLLILKNFPPF